MSEGPRSWHSITSISHLVPRWKLKALADEDGMVDTVHFYPPLAEEEALEFTDKIEEVVGRGNVLFICAPEQKWVFRRA